MKLTAPFCLLTLVVAARAAELPPRRTLETTVQTRIGFDSNPAGVSGTSAAVLGDEDTLTYAAGVTLAAGRGGAAPKDAALKVTYAGEAVRFDRWAGENFATHRLGAGGRFSAGDWMFTGEGSSLLVAGHRDTLTAVPTVNANSTALWRERRRQWQHRGKIQGETVRGECVLRVGAKVLAYEYGTRVKPGNVAFANRSDLLVSTDAGWKRSANSLWLTGVRVGRQRQEVVTPGDADYSNDYLRLGLGWEGKLFGNTAVAVMGGPDFRDYAGDVAAGFDRSRATFWLEGGTLTKLGGTLAVSTKVARMAWLSSTGRSAYLDSSAEGAISKALTPAWTVQLTGKVHQSDYYPAVRDDWESIVGVGVTWKPAARTAFLLEASSHHAWNEIKAASEREFDRVVVNLGVSVKF
jgi:hypothetical protein